MSQGPAVTREPVATRPRASTRARLKLGRDNMSNHSGKGTSMRVFKSSTKDLNGH
jgi:hypothetical protein